MINLRPTTEATTLNSESVRISLNKARNLLIQHGQRKVRRLRRVSIRRSLNTSKGIISIVRNARNKATQS